MEEIKPGDKLLCRFTTFFFTENEYYQVDDVVSTGYYIFGNENVSSFWINKELLMEHFYSKNEERSIKLERLSL